jgi:hypothetical protein
MDRIASLVTEDGHRLPVEKRTAAVIGEVYQLQDRIESCRAAQIELIIDLKNGSVRRSVREIEEPRRIE